MAHPSLPFLSPCCQLSQHLGCGKGWPLSWTELAGCASLGKWLPLSEAVSSVERKPSPCPPLGLLGGLDRQAVKPYSELRHIKALTEGPSTECRHHWVGKLGISQLCQPRAGEQASLILCAQAADAVTYQPEGCVQREHRNQSGTSRRHLRSGPWTHPSRHAVRGAGSNQCGTGPSSAGTDQVLTTRQLAEAGHLCLKKWGRMSVRSCLG